MKRFEDFVTNGREGRNITSSEKGWYLNKLTADCNY